MITQASQGSTRLTRIENDLYETENKLGLLMVAELQHLGYSTESMILEPCAGNRSLVDTFVTQGFRVFHSDITDDCNGWHGCLGYRNPENLEYPDSTWLTTNDAASPDYWESLPTKPDFTVTNPPFNQAHLILPLALEYSKIGVSLMLRSSYLEPCTQGNPRGHWLLAHSDRLARVSWVNPRPKFRADTKGSDSATVVIATWLRSWSWSALGVPCPFGFLMDWK